MKEYQKLADHALKAIREAIFLLQIRFHYSERPIIFYAVCYMMVSLILFIGFLLEEQVTCNASSPAQYKASTVT